MQADTKANALNPPFQQCPVPTTEATYFIEGQANIKDVLTNNPSSEVGLILYVDLRQIPEDIDNQIINTNNLFIKGQIVANPNDVTNQRAVQYDIKRIYTSCQTTPFFDGKKIINENTGKKNSLTTATAIQDQINPPFAKCLLTDSESTSTGETLPIKRTVKDKEGNVDPNLTVELKSIPYDYARHTIVGKVKGSITQNIDGKQFVTFVLHNVMPLADPAKNPTSVEGNNNQIAGDIIINPGQKSGTQEIKETVTRISTGCQECTFCK